MSTLNDFLREPHCDLGSNAQLLINLTSQYKNANFLDLGVRLGVSSACMSFNAVENNNQVHGCDLSFRAFDSNGARFVAPNYQRHLADSVTLGKMWVGDPFDVIFVDTIHTREQVLAELYYWSNHLNENGYFVFHDSHWDLPGDEGWTIGAKMWRRVDHAITDFFNLPKSLREMDRYETEDIALKHYPPSYGMTFVQVKKLNSIDKFKANINWEDVFECRNYLNNLHFNKDDPEFIDYQIDVDNIKNELVINP